MDAQELYKQDSIEKRVLLEFPHAVLTCGEVREDMVLTHAVNAGEDYNIGSSGAAELTFSVIDFDGAVSALGLAGQELRYRAGIRTSGRGLLPLYRRLRAYLLLPDGGVAYAVYKTKPYLRVWDISGEPARLPDPAQPSGPPRALFLHEGRLYCALEKEPFLSVYGAAEGTLAPLPSPKLTAFDCQRLARFCAEERAFTLRGNKLLEYRKSSLGAAVTDFTEDEFTFATVGYFTAEKPTRSDERILSVKAYDRMTRFDIAVDEWLAGLRYPLTLRALLTGLCAKAGVPLAAGEFLNSGYSVRRNFRSQGVTGRQVVQWAAQLAASFARINPEGELELARYTPRAYALTPNETWGVSMAEYAAAPVDKLQVRVTDNDIGVIVGTGENLLLLENNALLYAENDAELRPVAQSIFDAIKGVSYVPYEFAGKGNPLIRAGDTITITTAKGTLLHALIMRRRLTGVQALRDEYAAQGSARRKTQSGAVNQQLIRLRGRTNELTRTIDETVNRLYDAKTGDITVLQLTANSLQSQITDANGSISVLRQTATSLQSQITSVNGEISTLRQTATSLSLTVRGQGELIASITVSVSELESQIELKADKITLQGYVTFNNLQDGATVISGGNIRTGTISAARLSADVLTTGNISAKNLTLTGVFLTRGTSGGVRIENGVAKFTTSGWGDSGTIYYSTGSWGSGVHFDSNAMLYVKASGSLRLSFNDIYFNDKRYQRKEIKAENGSFYVWAE